MDDDESLVARSLAGELGAFEVLVRRYHGVACRVAALAGAGTDCEDVAQEAFVRAYDGLAGFRAGSPFKPWFLRIVVNLARNLHRTRTRRAKVTSRVAVLRESVDEVTVAHDPHGVAVTSERSRELWSALLRLPEKDRQVLGCRYLLGLTEAETAQVLGWPRGSVKSRTSRALARLREIVPHSLNEPEDRETPHRAPPALAVLDGGLRRA
ncbi:RNA polymerase sigma factor [Actinokineospora globicatena]|uniref:RNA polymerase sigma factor n=1 Tax=Actinokineospora globicatena TaxID=103729 RepID=UPI0020A55052|nr:RNA polymerase sigma factor [Actinokineospora globicatena]MCP2305979.1 RNA polymerase sigma-70 factor, ECF subfamily [Actinokineospora globicatena]GLW80150.1 RNA polymerase sigma factor [Actinokineospora globicatena]GLW86979.1 RNA polymerase sigma factor [Actinokineospora globicatena]